MSTTNERKRPSALRLHLDSRTSLKGPPTAYLAQTPQPQSAALQHTKQLEGIHSTAFKCWERYDNADCALVIPIDEPTSAKRSRLFSHLLDKHTQSTPPASPLLLSPRTPFAHAPRRRSSEVSISGAAATSAGLTSGLFNYDIALPEGLGSSTQFWPPRHDDRTPRASVGSIASVSTIRPTHSRKSSVVGAALKSPLAAEDAHEGDTAAHPRLLVLHLHKEFLTTQSSLFKAIFGKLEGVEEKGHTNAHTHTAIQDKTEQIAAETRATLARLSRDVNTRAGTIPRILPLSGAVYLPIPDPHSLLFLLQVLYFGHGPFLESHLDNEAVKWEGLVQNAEYLGVDPWIKRVLGRWWNRHVNGKRRVSAVSIPSTPGALPESGGGRRSVSMTQAAQLGQLGAPSAHAVRPMKRNSGVHSHLKQSLHDFDLVGASKTHQFLESADPAATTNQDSYEQTPSPKSEEGLSKRLRNI